MPQPQMKAEIRSQILSKPHYRLTTIKREAVDVEKRTVNYSFASGTPLLRYWGVEILDMAPESVRLQRWQNSPPFLYNHSDRRGVIENGKLENGRLTGTARLSRNPAAEELLRDIADEIAPHSSVGYMIHRFDELKPEEMSEDVKQICLENGCPAYRCMWEPYEGSSVDIPADINVGVEGSRSLEFYDLSDISSVKTVLESVRSFQSLNKPQPQITQERTMPELTKEQLDQVESERKTELEAIGEKFGLRIKGNKEKMTLLVKDAIDLKIPVERFRGDIYLRVHDDKPLETPASYLGLSDKNVKKYSISRAIASMLPNYEGDAGLERECSKEIAKNLKRPARGMYVPYDRQIFQPEIPLSIQRELDQLYNKFGIARRDLTVASATGAGNLVGTTLLGGSFIEMLRNKMLLTQLGARLMPGMVGNVDIPKQTGGATAYWIGEQGPGTESQLSVGLLQLRPKQLMSFTDFSRLLLLQGTPAVDLLVVDDINTSIRLKIDAAGFHGSGSANQPTGIALTTGVGSVAGAAFSRAKAISHRVKVMQANADRIGLSYVTNALIWGTLKGREEVANFPRYIIDDEDRMVGIPVNVTEQIDANYLFHGDFTQVLIPEWGVLDLTLDNLTQATAATLRIIGIHTVDVGVRRPGAFSVTPGDFS